MEFGGGRLADLAGDLIEGLKEAVSRSEGARQDRKDVGELLARPSDVQLHYVSAGYDPTDAEAGLDRWERGATGPLPTIVLLTTIVPSLSG